MTCSALDAKGSHMDKDYRQHRQTYLMSNAFQDVVDNDEDGFLFSAAVCLPNPDPDHLFASPFLGSVDLLNEPPQGVFAIASDVAMNLADYHSPGLVKHIVGAFNAQEQEVGGTPVPMPDDNVEKEEPKPVRMVAYKSKPASPESRSGLRKGFL